MKKVKTSYVKSKYKKRDIITVIMSVCALIGLIFFLKYVVKRQNNAQLQTIKEGYINQDKDQEEQYTEMARKSICINEIYHDGAMVNKDDQICVVEIYNPSDDNVDISNYYVCINNSEYSYSFPQNTIINGRELKTFNISLKETSKTGICYQLQYDGNEYIRMVSADNEIIDQVIIPKIDENESYGRIERETLCYAFMNSSIGARNDEEKIIKKSYPVFAVPSGFYDDNFNLELTTRDGYRIYYTTDGSDPTVNSIEYTAPILITDASYNENNYSSRSDVSINRYTIPSNKVDKCVIIKAVSVDEKGNYSDITTGNYFINFKNKLTDYGMNIISIVTDPKNLFDYWNGIYVNGITYDDALITETVSGITANYWMDWEKDAIVNFFSSDGKLGYQSTCKLSTYHDAYLNNAQKSLQLGNLSNKEWKSEFEEFIDSDENQGSVVLSSARNDTSTLLRNRLAQESMNQYLVGTQDVEPCVVFIDGEFWGVYNILQNYTEDTVSKKYNVNSEDVVLFHNKTVIHGQWSDMTEYNDMIEQISTLDMSQQTNYDWICSKIDIQSLIDYYCCQIYVGTSDWNPADTYIWRTSKSGSQKYYDQKWRWFLCQADSSAGVDKKSSVSIDSFLSIRLNQDPLYNALIQNKSFCNQLSDTMLRLGNLTFSENQIDMKLNAYTLEYEKAMVKSYSRYGVAGGQDTYESNISKIMQFYSDRMYYMVRYVKEHFGIRQMPAAITISTSDPLAGTVLINNEDILLGKISWTGYYFIDTDIEIEAKASEGYKFIGWKIEKGLDCNNVSDVKTVIKLLDEECVLTAEFEKVE